METKMTTDTPRTDADYWEEEAKRYSSNSRYVITLEHVFIFLHGILFILIIINHIKYNNWHS